VQAPALSHPEPAAPSARVAQVNLMGFAVDKITARGAMDLIMAELAQGRGGWVLTPNVEILRRLHADPEYAAVCSGATLRLADGMPLIWASWLQRTPLPERVAGSDLIWTLAERAAAGGRRVFFLGGNPGTAESAAKRLEADYPGLIIAGTECPPFGFEHDHEYLEQLADRMVRIAPDICFVGLGSGKQDRLIAMLRARLPSTWFLGLGVSFSFVSGEVRRAPPWVRRIGLEWLFRLTQEPARLGRRYILDGLPFAARLLVAASIAGVRRSTGQA
jgi:N-acetylglucosaminyldiphosphoundecaprenol N-acetyl-beta-D-mannosaminyltransferase